MGTVTAILRPFGALARVVRYLVYCLLLVAKPLVLIAGAFGSRLCYVAASVTLFARLLGAGHTGTVIGLAVAGVLCSVLLAGYDHLLALVLPPARPAAVEG